MWLNDIYGGDVKVSRLLKKLFFFLNEKKFLKKKKYFLINFR